MKQTSVEWLVEQIKSDQNQKALSASEWMQVIEQAKAMEKEQIIDAWMATDNQSQRLAAEQYYKKTYEK